MDRIDDTFRSHDDEPAFEAGLEFVDRAYPNDALRAEITSFGAKLMLHTQDSFRTLALLTDAVVMASPEVSDKTNSAAAQGAYLMGTVTGLYIAKEMLGDHLTPEAILSMTRTLGSQDDTGRVSNAGLVHEGENLLIQMQPKSRSILSRWAKVCDGTGMYQNLYELGFGLTMGGANKALYEINILKQLEEMTDWDISTE